MLMAPAACTRRRYMSSAPWLHVAIKHDAACTLPLLGKGGLCCWQQEAATWARVIKHRSPGVPYHNMAYSLVTN
jgi:hypothetical protein